MLKLLVGSLLTLALAACGGGGSGSSATVPALAGAQNPSPLGSPTLSTSSGTIAAGYIECDTAANIAAANNCNNYANFSPAVPPAVGGTFTFTAIAATATGVPIVQQVQNGNSMSFPNGAYQVVESPSDNPPILSIVGGPWSAPGAVLAGPAGAYGNHVSVQCIRVGSGNLQLQLVSSAGSQALPLATSNFSANATTVNCSGSGSLTIF